jgi:stage V sporulation protein SpoVS
MFTIQQSRNVFQSVACMLLAVIIVSGSLTIGAVGAQSLEQQAIAALAQNA